MDRAVLSVAAILCISVLFVTGCDSTEPAPPNQAPNASFTSGAASNNALKYTFDASGSIDTNTGGQIESFEWEFGDGESASGQTATHTYAEAGIYDVTLTVVDEEGSESSRTQTISASAPPSVSFTATPQADPRTYAFDAGGSSDPDGEIATYIWRFGDGSGDTTEVPTTTHTYDFTEDQDVDVTLTAIDDIGTTNSSTKVIAVDAPTFVMVQKANWEVVDFSSQQPDRPDRAAVLAIDEDASTFWHTPWCCAEDEYGVSRPQPPHSITIDMGEISSVYRLRITGRDGNYMNNPKQVTLKFSNEYSGEDTNWRSTQSFTLPFDENGEVIQTTVSLETPVDARYFKFTSTKSVNNDLLNLAELTAITTQEAANE